MTGNYSTRLDNRPHTPRIMDAKSSYTRSGTKESTNNKLAKRETEVMNTFSQGIKLAGITSLALLLGACVSNPSNLLNTINTVSQVAGGAQGGAGGMNGGMAGGMAGVGLNALAGGGVATMGDNSVAAMSGAQGDPRFGRAEDALKQINLSTASCKEMQAKKQATLNSLAEIESLTSNLMFKQLHERLRIQNDSMAGIAKAKKCALPTVASSKGSAETKTADYSKMNCNKLISEYRKLNADITAAESSEQATTQGAQIQGGVAAITQIGALLGGTSGMGNTQQMAQMAQMAGSVAGTSGADAAVSSGTNSLNLLKNKTDLEAAASKKRCKLGS